MADLRELEQVILELQIDLENQKVTNETLQGTIAALEKRVERMELG